MGRARLEKPKPISPYSTKNLKYKKNPTGKRPFGKPRMRWKDLMKMM